jgi:hypothetical protein
MVRHVHVLSIGIEVCNWSTLLVANPYDLSDSGGVKQQLLVSRVYVWLPTRSGTHIRVWAYSYC